MLLNCHSYHSLRYGTLEVEQLVCLAKEHGHTSVALTDINSVGAIYEFITLCRQHKIHPIVGMEFKVEQQTICIALAKNNLGLQQINTLNTYLNQGKFEKNKRIAIIYNQVKKWDSCYVIYPFEHHDKTLEPHEYIGIHHSQLNKLYAIENHQYLAKMVILHPVSFQSQHHFNLHKILRSIELNTLLSQLPLESLASEKHHMVSQNMLLEYYKNYPQIISTTQDIVGQCVFCFDFNIKRNKQHFTSNKKTDLKLLTHLAQQGLYALYGYNNHEAQQRLEMELEVIDSLNFSGYFLITHDIINYSLSRGFMHIGRGSGANSIVGYCLGITHVCPLELDLYFERFLNINRSSPPDFDIDWSWDQRDTILDYIFEKYPQKHVAFCGAITTFKYRSVLREIGKTFGLPKSELDALSKHTNAPLDPLVQKIHYYGKMLTGFPNQRSMHPCGILISDTPLTELTSLDYPLKGYPVAQLDMHTAEQIGYDKFDILSQRGLGHIKECVDFVKQNKNIEIDIKDISLYKDHPISNKSLAIANTIGCFYIESPAMRGLLKRLKCDNYLTLVAASSIIRPGVAKSGMMQEYIFRHNNPDKFDYFHPVFEQQLKQTYGIMVYQEDVIKIALHFAGLPPQDGDVLRRAMTGKNVAPQILEELKNRFFTHAKNQGHPLALTQEIYRQIESFAGYSFCKAHSASYALESYQSLYLKTHYPIEFICAVINNQGGFYRSEVYIHEAKMAGAKVVVPCINNSDFTARIAQQTIYLGLSMIIGIDQEFIHCLIKERNLRGPYIDIHNFIQRNTIGLESLNKLIWVGSFACFNPCKSELLLQATLFYKQPRQETELTLLLPTALQYEFPKFEKNDFEDAFDELEHLGFTVNNSMFDLLKTSFRGDIMARDLDQSEYKTVKMVGYLIATKHVPTQRGSMYFGTWIDVEGTYFDTVHFADSLHQYPFLGAGCYLLLGQVQLQEQLAHVVIQKMAKLAFIADPRFQTKDPTYKNPLAHIKQDHSPTQRAPYPTAKQINLPREAMK